MSRCAWCGAKNSCAAGRLHTYAAHPSFPCAGSFRAKVSARCWRRSTPITPSPDVKREPAPRACLGLFAAAESLGFGFVHGIPPYFYLENLDREALSRMGLSPEGAEQRQDVYVRIPAFRESVFRAAVARDGVPVADIVQVWLDVSTHPARGEARPRRSAIACLHRSSRRKP